MGKIRKIYSAVDADEIKAMMDQGFVVRGIFGSSVAQIIKKSKEEEKLGELQEVHQDHLLDRFRDRDTRASYPLFAVVQIFSPIDVTDKVMDVVSIGHSLAIKAGVSNENQTD